MGGFLLYWGQLVRRNFNSGGGMENNQIVCPKVHTYKLVIVAVEFQVGVVRSRKLPSEAIFIVYSSPEGGTLFAIDRNPLIPFRYEALEEFCDGQTPT